MSQHIIELDSPIIGSVTITLGMDARLGEVFVTILGEDYTFEGPPGITVEELSNVVHEQTRCRIPPAIVAAVLEDQAAVRAGATDVNRLVVNYNVDGSVATRHRW